MTRAKKKTLVAPAPAAVVPAVNLIAEWAAAAAPPPNLTVSEWADEKRVLPETSAAKGARWQTSDAPYLRGIMDAIHEPGVKKIAIEKSAQVGGSECVNNIIGYLMEHAPCPMLLVQPSESVSEEYSKERLTDMIRSTPALSEVIDETKSTLSYKAFPGGFLVLGGANTPNTFARRSVRVAFGDDLDRFPPTVGEEGDPFDLLSKRTNMFYDGVVYGVSTPTLKGGRIDTLYQRSDQRRYFVTCPACLREDWIAWSNSKHFHVTWTGDDPRTARLSCAAVEHGGCGGAFAEPIRRAMVRAGGWRPTATAKELGLIGFHLPAMITTLGNATLEAWVSEFLAANGKGKESLRVFINTTLAEGWEDRGARMDSHVLMARREDYGAGVEVPAAAVAITAGVDVQENRFELLVQAWGPADERWVIDWRTIPGDPKLADTRAKLLEALSRKYSHASGHLLPIHATCIDSGYATDQVYDFVLAHQARRIYATKGFAERSGQPIVGKPSEKTYGKSGRPVRLYPINVDDAKGDIMNALSLIMPGPRYMHFPAHLDTVGEEFFAQLCAEHRETRYNRAGIATHQVWVLDRERNEALDCAVMNLAAFRLLNPNIRQMLEALQRQAPKSDPGSGTPPAAAPPRPVGRRTSTSSYLGGQR